MELKLLFKYLRNRKLKEHSEGVFEGISNGRKRALENWFKDRWIEIDTIRSSICTLKHDDKIQEVFNNILQINNEFCEIFILDEEGNVIASSCETHIKNNMSDLPNLNRGLNGDMLMYGPYIDKRTLDIDLKNKKFKDDVTLMFSCPYKNYMDEKRVLCCRALNDDMSNVIQNEDTHIYKESGDNYLFMIKSNRGIKPGTAISRSRFEDDTFTLGDNLKDGVRTSKWGKVKVKEHTEFEIIFTDPATKKLHQGVSKTIENGENLDCWPGYPDYRHIMVGGKGTTIKPPNCDETWGMMCEGDIAEIYNFKSINFKLPIIISLLCGIIFLSTALLNDMFPEMKILIGIVCWMIISIVSIYVCRKFIVNPLTETINILQDIAEGEGDLTKRVNKISSDEIGELSRWFNKFINSQMEMLSRVKDSSNINKSSVSTVSNITSEVKNGIEIIEGTVVDLLDNSKDQNRVFQDTRDKFSDISASIQEMDTLILEVSNITRDTNKNSKNAKGSSVEVLDKMAELEKLIKGTVEQVSELQNHSNEITQVVNIIGDISSQTQLLALNATIEAARAGESGKGFAIVASEISKLALETSEATESIGKVIGQVKNKADSAYEYANKINNRVEESTNNIKQSMDLFNKVNEEVDMISNAMNSISEITINQSKSVSDVMNSVSEVADKVDESTKENSNKSKKSLEVVDNILSSTKQLEQATNMLKYSTQNMDEMVGDFKLI